MFTDDWPAFLLDLSFFVVGYLIYASPDLRAVVRRHALAAFVLGVAYWAMGVGAMVQGGVSTTTLSSTAILFAVTQTLSAWLLALALLGLAMRWPVQLLLIMLATAIGAFGLYEVVIRRIGLMRILFGVKAPPRVAGAPLSPVPSPTSQAARDATDRSAATSIGQETNLAQLFRNRSARFGGAIRWQQRRQGRQRDGWLSATYREQELMVTCVMSELDALGVRPGDTVGILSNTRWEWVIADWAVTGLGAITTTLYPSLTAETVAFILRDSAARYLFVEDHAQCEKICSMRADLPQLHTLILFDGSAPPESTQSTIAQSNVARDSVAQLPNDPLVLSFSALLTLRSRSPEEADAFAAARARAIGPDDPAALIYTSGTTGQPKGVIHTHRTVLAQLAGARAMLTTMRAGMVDVLFLPLAHVLGRLEHLLSLDVGGVMVIEPRMVDVLQTVVQVRPHVLLGVPRVYEKAYAAVREHLAAASPVERALFAWAERVGEAVVRRRQAQEAFSVSLRVQLALADVLALRRVRSGFGGRLRFAVSGGAPLNPRITMFFHAVGVPLLEGWGLTETGGAVTFNQLEHFRLGTVGRVYPAHELRIASDGEILVRGPCVFPRYHHNPEATTEALDADGWFHTGDMGHVDGDGFLTIVDRKKDLIATAGGKKIAPQRVEALLNAMPLVSHACVYCDRKPYLVALLTPTQKPRRKAIAARYQAVCEALYHPKQTSGSRNERLRWT